jgi:hypothetical protein
MPTSPHPASVQTPFRVEESDTALANMRLLHDKTAAFFLTADSFEASGMTRVFAAFLHQQ